jgi:hypothetical protein
LPDNDVDSVRLRHALVRSGRVVVDEPTDLPHGSKVDLLLPDAAADMGPEEQAALDASIGRGLAQADRDELHSGPVYEGRSDEEEIP